MSELFKFYRDRISSCPYYGFVSGSEILAVIVRSVQDSGLTPEEVNSIMISAEYCHKKLLEENYNAGWNEQNPQRR